MKKGANILSAKPIFHIIFINAVHGCFVINGEMKATIHITGPLLESYNTNKQNVFSHFENVQNVLHFELR